MKRKRSAEERIAFALRRHESGTAAAEIVRKTEVSEQTFCRRKRRYGGLGVAEPCRLKPLEEENRKLTPPVAAPSLDKRMPQDVPTKKP